MNSEDQTIPIISLEFSGMRHKIIHAITQQQATMDEMVKRAVEKATSPENIESVIEAEAFRIFDKVVKEEFEKFFRYNGEGRKIIAEAIKEKLLSKNTFSPLDDV